MACKNCKKKLDKGIKKFVPSFGDTLETLKQKKTQFYEDHLELSSFNYTLREKILVFIFGWTPFIVGYITIISFIVGLF